MKIKELTADKTLPKGFRLDPSLSDKYANSDLFKEKFDRNNEFIKRVGLPDFTKKR